MYHHHCLHYKASLSASADNCLFPWMIIARKQIVFLAEKFQNDKIHVCNPCKELDSENIYIETGLDRYMAKTTFFKSQASDWPPGCFMTDKNLTTLFIGSKKEKDTFSHTFLQRCNHSNQFTLCIKQNRQILWNIWGLIFGAGSSDLIWRGWQKGLVIKL